MSQWMFVSVGVEKLAKLIGFGDVLYCIYAFKIRKQRQLIVDAVKMFVFANYTADLNCHLIKLFNDCGSSMS